MIADRARLGILEQAVDGEVAALRVGLGVGELDLVGPAMIGISTVAAERRHFDRVPQRRHEHHAECPAHAVGAAAEDRADLLRRGVGRDVVVLRFKSQQPVAHAAACEIREEPLLAQRASHHARRFAGRSALPPACRRWRRLVRHVSNDSRQPSAISRRTPPLLAAR
jgi:hypothetical protein